MRPILVSLLLAASAAPSAAQAVHGRVLERGTDRPVASAVVELRANGEVRAQARTFDDGSFVLNVPGAGVYRVAAARLGYESLISDDLRIERLDSVALVIRMISSAVGLEPVAARGRRVPARLIGFYERSGRARQGHFLNREVIDQARATRTTDLLRRIPGLQFRPNRKGSFAIRGRGGCEPLVFIDGIEASAFGTTLTVDELVRPGDLEGIEVYGAAAIPPQFMRNHPGNECGAVLIWTRYER
jgi:hypothetical protein